MEIWRVPYASYSASLDLRRRNAQRRGLVAVDLDVDLRILQPQVAGDILESRHVRGNLVRQDRRVAVKLVRVGGLQRELVLRPGQPPADLDRRRVLQAADDAGDLGELRAEFLDDLVRRQRALRPRLEPQEQRGRCSSEPSPPMRPAVDMNDSTFGSLAIISRHLLLVLRPSP